MHTPHPFKVGRQAADMEVAESLGSAYARHLDHCARRILLRAYRHNGNKISAARALGLTYRQFRYQWTRLLSDHD